MNDELLSLMREKLTDLEKALVLETDAAQKFKLKKQIEDLERAITGRQAHKNPKLDASVPHLQARRLFVGRNDELVNLAKALENQQIVVIEGMGGVGKSYLVDHFAALSRSYYYEILPLNPLAEETVGNLIAQLAERLKVNPHTEELRAQLQAQNVLLHLENVDTSEMSKVAMQLVAQLQGCRLVLSGRLKDLGREGIFERIELNVFDVAEGIKQLQRELEDLKAAPLPLETLQALASALGGLPLAIHLCTGYLATHYYSAEDFLNKLHESQLKLTSKHHTDAAARNAQHCTLHAAFLVSFKAFQKAQPRKAKLLSRIAFTYALDVGLNLASYLFNLSEKDTKDFLYVAHQLSLVDSYQKKSEIGTVELRYRIHPLIAEFLRNQFKREEFKTDLMLNLWFTQRLLEPSPVKLSWIRRIFFKLFRIRYYVYNPQFPHQAWHELNNEHDVLRAWLTRIPLEFGFGVRVLRMGSDYAEYNGPWTAWRHLCERLFASALDDNARSDVLWRACRCAANLGDLEPAYQFAEQKAQLDQHSGNERGYALAKWQIADILQARGELDEALRIRQQEEMPVYERLDDVRSRAVTLGQIADILQARGELDEALRIRQEQIPVFERLGDVRSRAVTLGKIADIFYRRGELDEALRIRQQEQMPVYERLGDVHGLLVTQANTALLLMEFTPPRREEANQLLCLALVAARKMRIPQEQQIERILQRFEMECPNQDSP